LLAALRLLLAKLYVEAFKMLGGEIIDPVCANSWDQVVVDGDMVPGGLFKTPVCVECDDDSNGL
jgi:hypothetical protein